MEKIQRMAVKIPDFEKDCLSGEIGKPVSWEGRERRFNHACRGDRHMDRGLGKG